MKPEGREPECFSCKKIVVINSCRALYKTGGYGVLFGVPVSTMEDAQAEIGKLKRAGADIIKVMASGMVSLTNPGAITAGGFDKDELKFITQEAAAQGLSVMAHANGEPAISAAISAARPVYRTWLFHDRDRARNDGTETDLLDSDYGSAGAGSEKARQAEPANLFPACSVIIFR